MPRRTRTQRRKRPTAFRKLVARNRRRAVRPKAHKAVVSVPRGYQMLNNIKRKVYHFKDTMQLNDIVGTGVSVSGTNVFTIKDVNRYTALIAMFRQYKINWIKLRWRLDNVELTDNAKLPTLYCRYNYDPDLQAASITEDTMLRTSNVVVKQFHHNTIQGSLLEYALKPCILRATMLYPGAVGTATYSPSPAFNQWVDFDPSTTVNEMVFYGLQYFFTNVPTGITINLDAEYAYSCRDLI